MNRRGFLSSLIGGVATTAAVRTWPFRVFSFPSEIVKPNLQNPIDAHLAGLSVEWPRKTIQFGQGYIYAVQYDGKFELHEADSRDIKFLPIAELKHLEIKL